jgi:hypothetical protein
VRKLVTRHRPDLVERVEVVDGPLPVGEERVLVYLDVRGSPAAISENVSCQPAVMMMSGAEQSTHLPHHSSFAAASSLTTRLSLGERPVLAPDSVASAPVDVMKEAILHLTACSYSSVLWGFFIHREGLHYSRQFLVHCRCVKKL